VRIGLLSYHLSSSGAEAQGGLNPTHLGQYAVALAQQGHQVQWVSSTDTVDAYAHTVPLVADQADSLPATCRYVVPCWPYRLQTVRLYGIEPVVWHERPLHTRLFTFLCLLQRALPCQVWHAWGAFPAAYLTVYTARCLGIPAVVSYDAQQLHAGPQQAFEWQWVAQHVARALVASSAEQARLTATSAIDPTRIQVVQTHVSAAVAALTVLYTSLQLPTP
jgi:hypothetical protein